MHAQSVLLQPSPSASFYAKTEPLRPSIRVQSVAPIMDDSITVLALRDPSGYGRFLSASVAEFKDEAGASISEVAQDDQIRAVGLFSPPSTRLDCFLSLIIMRFSSCTRVSNPKPNAPPHYCYAWGNPEQDHVSPQRVRPSPPGIFAA